MNVWGWVKGVKRPASGGRAGVHRRTMDARSRGDAAGDADDARARADALGIPLFVLDLTGAPRPVNAPAGALDAAGTGNRAP